MNNKAFITSSFVGAIVMWLTGGLFHEVIMAHFFIAETGGKEHQGIAIIFLACLLLALMMTYLMINLAKDNVTLVHGLKIGAFVGVLWVFPHGLALAAAHGESLGYEFINGMYHMLEQGVGGVVIAMVYRRMVKTS